jgi:glycerophosphoryl diester phosphodiesterase
MRQINLFPVILSCFLQLPSVCCHPEAENNYEGADGPEIVSHRGANRLAPENTVASAIKAIESGARTVGVDVRRSSDGVYYIFQDAALDRTTNGTGLVSETRSAVIDTLDAGSWFAHEYRGEKVPRLLEFLEWIKGKARVYFDVQDARLEELIPLILRMGMENDCFFGFTDMKLVKEFRSKYPALSLKIHASDPEAFDSLKNIFNPQIIECPVDQLTDAMVRTCHKKKIKIMALVPGDDPPGFRMAIQNGVDMVNLDAPDVFSVMIRNSGNLSGCKLIAHKGGIVEGRYGEYDPASIREAINAGYSMLEVDVRSAKDSVLVVNHDNSLQRFFNDPRRISELTWDELKDIRAEKGNYPPLLFEELCRTCSGKVQLMIDVKGSQSSGFYYNLGQILEKYGLLRGAYFIDQKARHYFMGKAKFSVRVNEIFFLQEQLLSGKDIACHYFLFENGNFLPSAAIKWCQQHHITVVPSVNIWQYKDENPMLGAKRDLAFFRECGVTEFQIDSEYFHFLSTGQEEANE